MHLRWQVLQQEDHPTMNGLGSDGVVVIEHEGKICGTTVGHLADQHSQHHLWQRRLRGAQHREGCRADLFINGLQGDNQVGEKACGVVVLRF
jgi:hypothetical protein